MDQLHHLLSSLERSQRHGGPWHVLWVVRTERRDNLLYVPPKRLLSDGMVQGHESLAEARRHCWKDVLHARFDAWLLNVETGETELVPKRTLGASGAPVT